MAVWRYPELHEYQVHLPEYQGPLALLLDLIEQARLDITRLALAQITDQFLAHVRAMQVRSPELISAFLVVASRLLYIKTQALLPTAASPTETGEEEADPGEVLLRQLQTYRRFREAGRWLQARHEAGLTCFPSGFHGGARVSRFPSLEGYTPEDLARAARRLLAPQEPTPVTLPRPRVSVRERLQALWSALRRVRRLSFFRWLRTGTRPTREVVVASFLALLELLKQRRVRAEQPDLFADIWITLQEDDA